MSNSEVEKIVIHFKEKSDKPIVIKQGFALSIADNNKDAIMYFKNIDDKEVLIALKNAINFALNKAISEYDYLLELERRENK